jgi:SAM-dependent methyltransferase
MNNSKLDPERLPWTGERYVPEVEGELELEHLHRYAIARDLAYGKEVLDIACGEGYGSELLASVARNVTGIDISEETIAHASRKYVRSNLSFAVGSCASIPMPDASVDLVVSFDDAHKKCSNLPGRASVENWNVPNHPASGGDDQPTLKAIRENRDEIDKRVFALFLDHWRNVS